MTYLQIVEIRREGDQVRHRVIATLGRYEEVQARRLIPLTQVRLYVVGAVREAGGRFYEDVSLDDYSVGW